MATVLLVDDERQILQLLSQMLRTEHTVITAESGIEAMAIYESYSDRIDLIITDVTMPGMSGMELVARLERLYSRRLSVVFVTGYSEHSIPPERTVVAKPFSSNELNKAIHRALQTGANPQRSPKAGQ